jgi:eukaryotic-like serine/threonine-protein kinase
MVLEAGTRLGPYEILALIAAGGMGEVYRARDSRLGRIVAIKVVSAAFGADLEMRRRFDDEARLAALLDHPRIGAIHDVGHDAGIDYLVMEFIDGQSLAARIAAGPLPFTELIGYAIELAAGVAYAHRRGVVHRDLKPGNVMITPNGLKIIDFGLGTLRHQHQRLSDSIAAMKTASLLKTDNDCISGTVGYLPPERLQGFNADHRADIFAFGAVVYEMAAGRRAFNGAAPAEMVAAILTAEPPPLAAQEPGLADLDWMVRRCMKKSPDERWQSMADVEAVLKRIASNAARPRPNEPSTAAPRFSRRRLIGIAMAAAALGALGALVVRRPVALEATHPIALTVSPPPGGGFTPTEGSVQSPQIAVSPDGATLAFVASGAEGVPQIWVRRLDSNAIRSLPGTAGASYPFWSASSRAIGFFADRQLKRVDLDGAPPRTLAPAPNGRGGTWNAKDVILFSRGTGDVIYRLDPNGTVTPQTTLSTSRGDTSHRWPQFLPDGRHFLYFARSTIATQSSIRFATIDGGTDDAVVESNVGAAYGSGQLLYVSDGALLAAPFDVGRGRLTGEPALVVNDIALSSNFYAAFSPSASGVLAYATKASTAELVWMSRSGARLGVAAGRRAFVDFRLSPDGRHLALAEVEPHTGLSDLRLLDLVRGTNLRLTTSPATDASPVFSPSGTRLVFRSNRERQHDLYIRPAGSGEELPFLKSLNAKYPTDWSRDGSFVVYHANDDHMHHDIWAAPVDHPEQVRALVRTEFDEMQGQLSPSGRWLAFTSNQSSRLEVYVQKTEDDGRKWQISTDGGSDPKWSANDQELYYVARDGRLIAVSLSATASNLEAGTPQPLFQLRDVAALGPYPSAYDVHRDGRFLVREPIDEMQTLPLNVVVNWSPRSPAASPTR